jgi:LysM repeat protein
MAGKHARKKHSTRSKATLAVALGGGVAGGLALAPGASAAVYGPSQIAQAAKAGCPQLSSSALNVAVKVAMAESGGNTDAHNPYGEDSRGLWQINVRAHGSPWGNLYDPVTNAKAMCDISKGGTSWGPWTTYTKGLYLNQPGYTGSAPVTPPTPPKPSATPTPTPSGTTHTVRPGDTLWAISPGHDWVKVWKLNKERLRDPNLIYPGQVVRLR